MIDKIKKLLALASDPSASPQEAETAARQAAKLMAKHEIDEYDLMMSQGSEWDLIEDYARGCRPGKKNAKDIPSWINMISYGVKLWCNVRVSLRYGGIILFKGRRSDVELAQWLHNTLVDACYSASKGRSISEANAFRNGYAAAIQARFKAMIKARESDPLEAQVGSTALVIVRDRLEQAMNERWGEPKKGITIKRALGSDGYAAGQAAHIPTNRPVTGTNLRRLA